jgi:hypothetical protein
VPLGDGEPHLIIAICDICKNRQWYLDRAPIEPELAVGLAESVARREHSQRT